MVWLPKQNLKLGLNMPPNPSKIMAPVQMQSSPTQGKSRDHNNVIGFVAKVHGREKGNRAKDKGRLPADVKEKGHVQSQRVGGTSPKQSKTNGSNRQTLPYVSPSVKPGPSQYTGRKSISPDGSYAGAKFSEAPNPVSLPMPPAHWLGSFSGEPGTKMGLTFSSPTPDVVDGQSEFEKITRDLKIMLKVES